MVVVHIDLELLSNFVNTCDRFQD